MQWYITVPSAEFKVQYKQAPQGNPCKMGTGISPGSRQDSQR